MSGEPAVPKDTSGKSLYEAISDLTAELSLDAVLQKVTDLSRELVGASYSALLVVGEQGTSTSFITSGISPKERERIGNPPEGKGVLGMMLLEGKPLRLVDLRQHPESAGVPPRHPIMRSFLGVPIVSKGRVLGDLYLTNKIGAVEFSESDEALVTLFAAQAAVAIENAQLFENESHRLAQLDVLNQIGRELTRIFDLNQLLQTVAERVREGFDYQNVQVFWVDHAANNARVRAQAGFLQGKVPLGTAQALTRGLVGWAARNKQTVMCNDVTQDPRNFAPQGYQPLAQLVVPVLVKEEVVAVINIAAMEPNTFDDSDLKTVETVADQVAVAIENARLYRQQQEQSRRLAVVEERDRIGRDLHDGVIQSIYAVGLTLEDISSEIEEHPTEAGHRVEGVVRDLNQVISDIRSYIMDLRPRELQGRSLDEALESLVRYLEDRTGVTVAVDLGIDLAKLSEKYAINLWHILQEAFSNIEKYAQASRVTMSLAYHDGILDFWITDDGVGFEPEEAEMGRGYGLSNIKDRAERLGGILILESAPGKGTQLNIRVPMDTQVMSS